MWHPCKLRGERGGGGQTVPSNRRREAKPNQATPAQNGSQEHLAGVAEHTLDFFAETAATALEALGEKRPAAANVLAAVNTLTAGRAVRNLEAISEARTQELRILAAEPAIAR